MSRGPAYRTPADRLISGCNKCQLHCSRGQPSHDVREGPAAVMRRLIMCCVTPFPQRESLWPLFGLARKESSRIKSVGDCKHRYAYCITLGNNAQFARILAVFKGTHAAWHTRRRFRLPRAETAMRAMSASRWSTFLRLPLRKVSRFNAYRLFIERSQ